MLEDTYKEYLTSDQFGSELEEALKVSNEKVSKLLLDRFTRWINTTTGLLRGDKKVLEAVEAATEKVTLGNILKDPMALMRRPIGWNSKGFEMMNSAYRKALVLLGVGLLAYQTQNLGGSQAYELSKIVKRQQEEDLKYRLDILSAGGKVY